ncbi:polysaccharide deacetylase family protein [Pedobacter roseus]|uniref:Polysaccharide deacetylase family protein n=1 Tax=Pedobacter roseus TaxID=336820 RepID=A0A7G9QKT8_9SPHI|nr:polysaccharide deacetylase family protein [Pedobacter roseus]QNN43963.1 polysaccharide deacetylase family protein [Pedobacter roseus]
MMINIALTFDDGPSVYTEKLIEELLERSIKNVTWFVSRKQVSKFNYVDKLKALQSLGGEIGIHEIHDSKDNMNWFPISSNSYKTVKSAVEDLKIFLSEMSAHNINLRFVRLPGGEYSEIISYLIAKGCPTHQAHFLTTSVIDGNPLPMEFSQVKNDYDYLISELNTLGLKIWSGAPRGFPLLGGGGFFYNSWQAECSGINIGRGADNLTLNQSTARKRAGVIEQNFGMFEQYLYSVKEFGCERSLIVLAHDTSLEDLVKIVSDIDRMQDQAGKNSVELNFLTISELFKKIRA